MSTDRRDDNDLLAINPCVRGCVQIEETEDQPARIMGALHGHYCDRCYWRTSNALKLAAPLVRHVIEQVGGFKTPQNDGSQRAKKEAPLPFNVEAFNDANETYARLVYWSSLFATRLNLPIPVPAARAWRAQNNRIVGLPNDVTPDAAKYATWVMATWIEMNLDDICALPQTDDTSYFHDEIKDVYRINARFPREEQPAFADVRCSDDNCRGRLIVFPPHNVGDEKRIVCEKCGRHILPKDYGLMERVMRQVQADRALEAAATSKHKKAAAHLVRKYGKTA